MVLMLLLVFPGFLKFIFIPMVLWSNFHSDLFIICMATYSMIFKIQFFKFSQS